MENLNHIIAGNLRDIRKRKELSLEQVSSLTSISKSMLSQLERGEVNPTISTVYKLSLGLKVPVTAFTADKPKPFSMTGKSVVTPLIGDEGKYRLYPVFEFRERQDFEIFDLEFDEGGRMQGNRQMSGTREFITVYSGELTLIFNGREYVLKAGDSASYNAFDEYVYKNTGMGMVTASIVVHYPG
ncbi:XRE family transcriptional regulator [Lachnospiraceae bacterium 56-18]